MAEREGDRRGRAERETDPDGSGAAATVPLGKSASTVSRCRVLAGSRGRGSWSRVPASAPVLDQSPRRRTPKPTGGLLSIDLARPDHSDRPGRPEGEHQGDVDVRRARVVNRQGAVAMRGRTGRLPRRPKGPDGTHAHGWGRGPFRVHGAAVIICRMAYACPVCGYPGLTEPPRKEESGPSYEICPSCGYQFGYDDSEGIDYGTWRHKWLAAGMPWLRRNPPPPNWDPGAQLRALESGRSGEADRSDQALVELTGLLVLVAIIIVELAATPPRVPRNSPTRCGVPATEAARTLRPLCWRGGLTSTRTTFSSRRHA